MTGRLLVSTGVRIVLFHGRPVEIPTILFAASATFRAYTEKKKKKKPRLPRHLIACSAPYPHSPAQPDRKNACTHCLES